MHGLYVGLSDWIYLLNDLTVWVAKQTIRPLGSIGDQGGEVLDEYFHLKAYADQIAKDDSGEIRHLLSSAEGVDDVLKTYLGRFWTNQADLENRATASLHQIEATPSEVSVTATAEALHVDEGFWSMIRTTMGFLGTLVGVTQVEDRFGCQKWQDEANPYSPGNVCLVKNPGWPCLECDKKVLMLIEFISIVGVNVAVGWVVGSVLGLNERLSSFGKAIINTYRGPITNFLEKYLPLRWREILAVTIGGNLAKGIDHIGVLMVRISETTIGARNQTVKKIDEYIVNSLLIKSLSQKLPSPELAEALSKIASNLTVQLLLRYLTLVEQSFALGLKGKVGPYLVEKANVDQKIENLKASIVALQQKVIAAGPRTKETAEQLMIKDLQSQYASLIKRSEQLNNQIQVLLLLTRKKRVTQDAIAELRSKGMIRITDDALAAVSQQAMFDRATNVRMALDAVELYSRQYAKGVSREQVHQDLASFLQARYQQSRVGSPEKVMAELEKIATSNIAGDPLAAAARSLIDDIHRTGVYPQSIPRLQAANRRNPRFDPDNESAYFEAYRDGVVDIGNTPFEDLPDFWRNDNLQAANRLMNFIDSSGGIEVVQRSPSFIELTAALKREGIHEVTVIDEFLENFAAQLNVKPGQAFSIHDPIIQLAAKELHYWSIEAGQSFVFESGLVEGLILARDNLRELISESPSRDRANSL